MIRPSDLGALLRSPATRAAMLDQATRLRDAIPTVPVADRGQIRFYRGDEPEATRLRDLRDARRAALAARWQPLHDAVAARADGLVARLVAMHRPDFGAPAGQLGGQLLDPPHCIYCTHEDEYGDVTPLWPCPEMKAIADHFGIALPAAEDED